MDENKNQNLRPDEKIHASPQKTEHVEIITPKKSIFSALAIKNDTKIIIISLILLFISLFLPWLSERNAIGTMKNTTAFAGITSLAAEITFAMIIIIISILYFEFRKKPIPFFPSLSHSAATAVISIEILTLTLVQASVYNTLKSTGGILHVGAYLAILASISLAGSAIIRVFLKK